VKILLFSVSIWAIFLAKFDVERK